MVELLVTTAECFQKRGAIAFLTDINTSSKYILFDFWWETMEGKWSSDLGEGGSEVGFFAPLFRLFQFIVAVGPRTAR